MHDFLLLYSHADSIRFDLPSLCLCNFIKSPRIPFASITRKYSLMMEKSFSLKPQNKLSHTPLLRTEFTLTSSSASYGFSLHETLCAFFFLPCWRVSLVVNSLKPFHWGCEYMNLWLRWKFCQIHQRWWFCSHLFLNSYVLLQVVHTSRTYIFFNFFLFQMILIDMRVFFVLL